jgi:hypothetical protein
MLLGLGSTPPPETTTPRATPTLTPCYVERCRRPASCGLSDVCRSACRLPLHSGGGGDDSRCRSPASHRPRALWRGATLAAVVPAARGVCGRALPEPRSCPAAARTEGGPAYGDCDCGRACGLLLAAGWLHGWLQAAAGEIGATATGGSSKILLSPPLTVPDAWPDDRCWTDPDSTDTGHPPRARKTAKTGRQGPLSYDQRPRAAAATGRTPAACWERQTAAAVWLPLGRPRCPPVGARAGEGAGGVVAPPSPCS